MTICFYRQEYDFFLNDFGYTFFTAIISSKTKHQESKGIYIFELHQKDKQFHVIVRQVLTVNVIPQLAGLSISTHFDHCRFNTDIYIFKRRAL